MAFYVVSLHHLGTPDDLMLQNATLLRKSAPWPSNISAEHVSCSAPATRCFICADLLQRPMPANVFEMVAKPSHFVHFWPGAEPHALATQNDVSTSKNGASMWRFNILTSTGALRHNAVHFLILCEHFNFQECSDVKVLCTFWLGNLLRATAPCTFWTSQLPKAFQTWGASSFLTSKSAARHNSMQLFISHLARWLRTRRFSESHKSLEKTQWFTTCLPFPAPASSFFWFFLFSDILFSSLLFSEFFPAVPFMRPYCQKFDFETSIL